MKKTTGKIYVFRCDTGQMILEKLFEDDEVALFVQMHIKDERKTYKKLAYIDSYQTLIPNFTMFTLAVRRDYTLNFRRF